MIKKIERWEYVKERKIVPKNEGEEWYKWGVEGNNEVVRERKELSKEELRLYKWEWIGWIETQGDLLVWVGYDNRTKEKKIKYEIRHRVTKKVEDEKWLREMRNLVGGGINWDYKWKRLWWKTQNVSTIKSLLLFIRKNNLPLGNRLRVDRDLLWESLNRKDMDWLKENSNCIYGENDLRREKDILRKNEEREDYERPSEEEYKHWLVGYISGNLEIYAGKNYTDKIWLEIGRSKGGQSTKYLFEDISDYLLGGTVVKREWPVYKDVLWYNCECEYEIEEERMCILKERGISKWYYKVDFEETETLNKLNELFKEVELKGYRKKKWDWWWETWNEKREREMNSKV